MWCACVSETYFVDHSVTASAELLGDLVVEISEVAEVGLDLVVFVVLVGLVLLLVPPLLLIPLHAQYIIMAPDRI